MNQILHSLSSLGCNFILYKQGLEADPEKTIIEVLDYFWIDKKIFSMAVGLLRYRIHHLINLKRLWLLSEDLDEDHKAVLAVLTLKISKFTGDERYLHFSKKLRFKKIKINDYPKKYSDPFYIQRKGIDKDFKLLKVTVADFFSDQPERKFKTLKNIYSSNKWLRIRAIVGPEYRADTLYLTSSGKACSQADVVSILGCNKSSISRIWSSLGDMESLLEFV
ncbi:MAG: hypothetical protein HOO06_14375 [Bdellovibrionaceae bacterium]|jgi:hypothetical protein|nr:hypothetical protein [Pseudobdellovibrionaceae bacterium]